VSGTRALRNNATGLIRWHEGRRVKACSGCKHDLPIERFAAGSGPGGFQCYCRACCAGQRHTGFTCPAAAPAPQ
jgi:hypothetical protein